MESYNLLLYNKCRSCLTTLGDKYNLFEIFDQDLSLSDIFMMTMNFKVEQDDKLPTYFCKKCANIMVDFYNFKNIFQENNLYLKSISEKPDEKILSLSETEDAEEEVQRPVEEVKMRDDEEIKPVEQYTFLPENECVLVNGDKDGLCDSNGDLPLDDENSDQEEHNLSEADEIEWEGEVREVVEMKESDSSKKSKSVHHNKNAKSTEKYTRLPEDECILVMDDTVTLPDSEINLQGVKYKNFQHAKYSCSLCNDYFLTKCSYIKHMNEKHQVIPEYDKSSWKKLKITPSITTPLLNIYDESVAMFCKECEAEFVNLPDLQKHLRTHVTVLCHICGLYFQRKSSLKDHLSIHSSTKLYPCPVCHKRFSRKSGLWTHKMLHISPRRYVCEQCGKRFNEKGTLTMHRKTVHLRHRNFYCQICNLSFPLKATLQKHTRRRHTIREKAFVCSICNNSYAERYSMLRHFAKKHINVEKFICRECKKEYLSKYTLMNHYRKHHSPKADISRLTDYCEKTKIGNDKRVEFEVITESEVLPKY